MTEDKKLNAAESLALIGRMIENTRNRMAGSAGLHLLTWGYVTVATTLAVWVPPECIAGTREPDEDRCGELQQVVVGVGIEPRVAGNAEADRYDDA